jgi:hypothetical protein
MANERIVSVIDYVDTPSGVVIQSVTIEDEKDEEIGIVQTAVVKHGTENLVMNLENLKSLYRYIGKAITDFENF